MGPSGTVAAHTFGGSLTDSADIPGLGAALRALNLFPEAAQLPAPC